MVRVIDGTIQERKHTQVLEDRISKLHAQGGEEFSARLANKLGLRYADLHIMPLSTDDILTIPMSVAKDLNVVCYSRRGHDLYLGSPDPQSPKLLKYIEALEEKKGWNIRMSVISPSSLVRGLDQYGTIFFVDNLDSLRLSLTGEDLEEFEGKLGKLIDLKNRPESLSTTEILAVIFSGATSLGASDIHIEPQKNEVRLRFRIDGVLQDVVTLPYAAHKSIISRIKLMSKMKINIRDKAQDGRFSFQIDDKQIDVRASVIPGKNAEGIVLRILNSDGINTSLESIGLTGKAYDDLMKTLGKTDGIILTTGPTGSGKTTTLYTIINHINSPESKIITIENPIEYEFDGIVQTEVSATSGYTFSKALRAIVRQDPDVILVGEIRDNETADIAINAALTGHLVLSTLHTNGAVATISRLIELGVRPTLIPPAADIFLAQRLVRKLCECKKEHIPATEVSQNILKMIALISPKAKVDVPTKVDKLWQPVGCAKCHGTGYKGRIGIFEALTITENVEKLILDIAGESEITKVAIEDGFITMTQDGILKALQGITSMEEVWRVTSESGIIEELYEKLMSQSLTNRLFISSELQDAARDYSSSVDIIKSSISDADSTVVLPFIFAHSINLLASDIHMEPAEDIVNIRLRIDGVLQTIGQITPPQYQQILGEIKNLAEIPTTIRQGVSDSRFGILLAGHGIDGADTKSDVRISIIIGGFGETVVMRLLDVNKQNQNFLSLGVSPYNKSRILPQAKKPYGMVLNTGPTGSGKTTTLYALIGEIRNDSIKIITIEDPIEYQLDGILQTQINKKEGYTFSAALRALLRQDPDVILVGEIRDRETAETAVSAAQTGHLLISTLHTNNAASSLQRLATLGISPDDLTSTLNAIMAQRLVRKLCDCKKQVSSTPQQKQIIETTLDTMMKNLEISPRPNASFVYTTGGCVQCNGIGFKGRTVVSEVLLVTDELARMVARGALVPELNAEAMRSGMMTMEQDGILKALLGETTLDEVRRATML